MTNKYLPPNTSPYSLICPQHQRVFLTNEEYMHQLEMPDSKWICPICMSVCEFDDYWLDEFSGDETSGS